MQAQHSLPFLGSPHPDPSNIVQATGSGAINMELFAKVPGNIAILLRLLEATSPAMQDFYVRYFTVQLLTLLAIGNSYRLQQASTAVRMYVSRPHAALGHRVSKLCIPLELDTHGTTRRDMRGLTLLRNRAAAC